MDLKEPIAALLLLCAMLNIVSDDNGFIGTLINGLLIVVMILVQSM